MVQVNHFREVIYRVFASAPLAGAKTVALSSVWVNVCVSDVGSAEALFPQAPPRRLFNMRGANRYWRRLSSGPEEAGKKRGKQPGEQAQGLAVLENKYRHTHGAAHQTFTCASGVIARRYPRAASNNTAAVECFNNTSHRTKGNYIFIKPKSFHFQVTKPILGLEQSEPRRVMGKQGKQMKILWPDSAILPTSNDLPPTVWGRWRR